MAGRRQCRAEGAGSPRKRPVALASGPAPPATGERQDGAVDTRAWTRRAEPGSLRSAHAEGGRTPILPTGFSVNRLAAKSHTPGAKRDVTTTRAPRSGTLVMLRTRGRSVCPSSTVTSYD